MNIWVTLSLGIIFATMLLQLVNYKLFHSDGRNSTRITLLMKQAFFALHAVMLHYATEIIRNNFPYWFGQAFGLFFFCGLTCWFFVFFRGAFRNDPA
jgi:hypothetical protein